MTVTDDTGKTAYDSVTVDVLPDEGEYIGTFTYKAPAYSESELNWEGYDCSNNRISDTEITTSNNNTTVTATVLFTGFTHEDGTLSLTASSLQEGTYSYTSSSSRTNPNHSIQNSSSADATAVGILGPSYITFSANGQGSGSVGVEYQGTYKSSYSVKGCDGGENTNDSGNTGPGIPFNVSGGSGADGSFSGSYVVDYSVPKTCDSTGCRESTASETFTWNVSRR